jgi:hypothetical protein
MVLCVYAKSKQPFQAQVYATANLSILYDIYGVCAFCNVGLEVSFKYRFSIVHTWQNLRVMLSVHALI